jgi:hypothetical protein
MIAVVIPPDLGVALQLASNCRAESLSEYVVRLSLLIVVGNVLPFFVLGTRNRSASKSGVIASRADVPNGDVERD